MIFTNDPSTVNEIIGSEGKCPSRAMEDNFQWYYKQRNEETPVIFQ